MLLSDRNSRDIMMSEAIKRTDKTPKATTVTFTFPDEQTVSYGSGNIILEHFTKEYIVEKKLFPYIPFYAVRYEKEIASEKDIDHVADELSYFRDELLRLHDEKKLSDAELIDLMGFVNIVITHITNGNKNEERLVEVMGGTIIETESEKWMRQGIQRGIQQGQAKMLVELGKEDGLDDETILQKIQKRIGPELYKSRHPLMCDVTIRVAGFSQSWITPMPKQEQLRADSNPCFIDPIRSISLSPG
ncbi:MAG: hypothetical protein K2P59_08970 [Acetatifactor sp.]|nr:hypothetical protein [Acetatifactor sp.]